MTIERLSSAPPCAAVFAAGLLAALLAATPAGAVMRGEPARDPEGTRSATVMVETPEGLCTGTVIGPTLVLTAAHCVSSRGRYRVRYLDRQFRRVAVPVARASGHPSFDAADGFAANDVGLVQVARPFPPEVRPAALPAPGGAFSWFAGSSSTAGEELIIAGFGSTERVRSRDGILREAIMRTAEPSIPGRGFGGLAPENEAERPGMCVGDSGGPVFRRQGRAFTVIGVLKGGTTDPGRECTSAPIYTPVRPFLPWILQVAESWSQPIGAPPTVEMRQ